MFPYPSGKGLHVGHPRGYTATDAISRFKKMQGYNVLHPIGYDAFGLPAEQYALKTGNSPKKFTLQNIKHFRKQLQMMGFMYDYEREVNTSHPAYYKITQEIFLLLFKLGLAELQTIDINWCPILKTVLANEEIVNRDGKMFSERGNFLVEKKPMQQWVLKITKYADRLLNGLEKLNWPKSIKHLQANWIGKTSGYFIECTIADLNVKVRLFTKQLQILETAKFLAIHPSSIVIKLLKLNNNHKVQNFIDAHKWQNDSEKENIGHEKEGFFVGYYLINPVNQIKLPIWITNFVVLRNNYAEQFCNPGFSKMHYLFCKKYEIGDITGLFKNYKEKFLSKDERKVLDYLKSNHIKFESGAVYNLRDWIFSRQRYWGEPIPLAYDKNHHIISVSENDLPLVLPELNILNKNKVTDKPLDRALEWKKTTINNIPVTRETNVMPQWAGSCWYYIGYLLTLTNNQLLDLKSDQAQKIIKEWLPVDLYVGGQEHAVLHLLYARFWHMVLYDAGLVSSEEPFIRLVNQGMILGPDHQKMSKSLGNIISVDSVISSHGADALRLTELFMSQIQDTGPWSMTTTDAMRKWLDKIYVIATNYDFVATNHHHHDHVVHKTLKNITFKLEKLYFNTCVSDLMILLEQFRVTSSKKIYNQHFLWFLQMLSLFAPFLSHELYQMLFGDDEMIMNLSWPQYDKNLLQEVTFKLPVQVNGKFKNLIICQINANQDDVMSLLKKDKKVCHMIPQIKKIIFIKNKIINLII